MEIITAASDCRREARHIYNKQGRIVTTWQRYGIAVDVADLSAGGARLRLETVAQLPPTFSLWVDSDRAIYPSRICWRRGKLIGIQFTGEPRRITIGALIE